MFFPSDSWLPLQIPRFENLQGVKNSMAETTDLPSQSDAGLYFFGGPMRAYRRCMDDWFGGIWCMVMNIDR